MGRHFFGSERVAAHESRLIYDFADSMGYAFIFPFVRLIAGREVATGAYIHYPTVSADMVKRVRKRSAGVENGGASSSWLRTQVKLL